MFLLSLLLSALLTAMPWTAAQSERETCNPLTCSTEKTKRSLDNLDDVYKFKDDMSPELLSSIDELTTAWKSGILVKTGYVLTDGTLNCHKRRCPDCSDDEIIRTFMAVNHVLNTRDVNGFTEHCASKRSVPGRLLEDVIHDGIEGAKEHKRLNEVEAIERLIEVEAAERLNEVEAIERLNEVEAAERPKEVEAAERLNEVKAAERLNEVKAAERLNNAVWAD